MDTNKSVSDKPTLISMVLRAVFFVLGSLFFVLGLIGIVVPGLPTTVFILLAAFCWARSSRRFYAWLLSHRFFGKMIIDWQTRRAIPKYAKYLAWLMMAVSVVVLYLQLPKAYQWLAGVLAIVSACIGLWMARLPDA